MTEKPRDLLTKYWPMIAGGVFVAVAWGGNTVQVAWTRSDVALTRLDIGGLRTDNKEILGKLDKLSDSQADMKAAIASDRATSIAAAASVGELRDRVRSLEARR